MAELDLEVEAVNDIQYVSVDVDQILVGEPLPCNISVYLDFRFITFRGAGDVVDRRTYDRLLLNKVKSLFVKDDDKKKWDQWLAQRESEAKPVFEESQRSFLTVREDANRKMMDIFQSAHPDKAVKVALDASKKLVHEVMKFPWAVPTLGQLQVYSKGTVDHSVNVSVLASYLAMQMGYTQMLILQHVAMGGLLHDIGKCKLDLRDEDSKEILEQKDREHPSLGLSMLESKEGVPEEVRMIVAQHHEAHDGTGYPKKLKGNQIYDLARIVSIANVFDELVGSSSGTLLERQKKALVKLDQVHYKKFDPQKLEKAIKILKLGV